MDNQMDLFDLLGEEEEFQAAEPSKKASKPAGKKEEKKAAKKAATTLNPKYKLPMGIMYLPGRTTAITGEGELLAKDIFAKASESVPAISSKIFSSFAKNKETFVPRFQSYNCKAKGKVTIKEATNIYAPDFTTIDHAEFEGKTEIDISDVIKVAKKAYGDDFKDIPMECVEAKTGTETTDLFVFFNFKNDDEIGKYKAPEAISFTLVFPTKATVNLTGKDGLLIEEIAGEFDCDKNNLLLYKLAEDKFFVTLNYVTGSMVAAPKETKYKVEEGTVLSLTFKQYPISPADFGGKTEVTKEDIQNFLVAKGHRDYGIANFVVDAFEKEKLILATIAGSKKGSAYHPLFGTDVAGVTYLEAGIPKIPFSAINFFVEMAKANAEMGEMLLELFYEPVEQKYLFIYPVQTQTSTSVDSESDRFFEHQRLSGLIKIGEFHSHGSLPAFFSERDTMDEKFRAGLYGVVGDIGSEQPSLRFRFSYGNGIFDEMTREAFLNLHCSPETEFANSWDYIDCLTADINQRITRFAYNSEKFGWLMEIGKHEVETMSAIPGLTVKPVVIGDELCYGVTLTGRKVDLEDPWVDGLMEMFKASEAEEVTTHERRQALAV